MQQFAILMSYQIFHNAIHKCEFFSFYNKNVNKLINEFAISVKELFEL